MAGGVVLGERRAGRMAQVNNDDKIGPAALAAGPFRGSVSLRSLR